MSRGQRGQEVARLRQRCPLSMQADGITNTRATRSNDEITVCERVPDFHWFDLRGYDQIAVRDSVFLRDLKLHWSHCQQLGKCLLHARFVIDLQDGPPGRLVLFYAVHLERDLSSQLAEQIVLQVETEPPLHLIHLRQCVW